MAIAVWDKASRRSAEEKKARDIERRIEICFQCTEEQSGETACPNGMESLRDKRLADMMGRPG